MLSIFICKTGIKEITEVPGKIKRFVRTNPQEKRLYYL